MSQEQPITTYTNMSAHCTTITSTLHEGELKGLYVTINAAGCQLNRETATRIGEEVLVDVARYLYFEKVKEHADRIDKAFHVIVNGTVGRIVPDDGASLEDVLFKTRWSFPAYPKGTVCMTAVPATVMHRYRDTKFIIRTANGTMYLADAMTLKPAKEVPDVRVG